MNTASKRSIRLAIDNLVFLTIAWGGAWALGFLLGFG